MRLLATQALRVGLPRRTIVSSTRKLRRPTSSAASRPRPVSSATLGAGSTYLARRHVMTQSQPQSSAAGNINNDTNSEAQNPITPESISEKLKERLGAIHADIVDMSGGCGQAFEATIVSPEFDKKNTLARHRLVNAALKQEIAAIHAWSPKCFSPDEWDRRQAQA